MAKEKCSICGTEVGWLSRWKLKDGVICSDCVEKLEKGIQKHTEEFTAGQIKQSLTGKLELVPPKIFQCAKGFLVINPVDRTMYMQYPMFIKSDEISLDSIIGYSYVENDKKYGVGRTLGTVAAGGILFGGVGAVIGAVVGSGPRKKIVNRKPIKPSGFEYNGYLDIAKRLMGELDLLVKKEPVEGNIQKNITVQSMSNADEIRKFKGLLDDGIITQEEFAIKRNELLGISEPTAVERESGQEDEEANYRILLKSTENKVMAIKAYRELVEYKEGIKETKKLIDQTPVVIFEGLSKKQADCYIQTFLGIDTTAILECSQ